MRTDSITWSASSGWRWPERSDAGTTPTLVFFFSSLRGALLDARIAELRAQYPGTALMGCSGYSEIHGSNVLGQTLSACALTLERTTCRITRLPLPSAEASLQTGQALGRELATPDLRLVWLLGPGTGINASQLLCGLRETLGPDVAIAGGLAGHDPQHHQDGWTCADETLSANQVVAVGLYGPHLRASFGCYGGWDAFGPERRITQSCGNLLYQLDGRPALELYRDYLGDEANHLPAAAQYFPLMVRKEGESGVVRTVLDLDPVRGCMISAGDLPQGYVAQLMHTNHDHLIDGASHAAEMASRTPHDGPVLALMVSCYGRQMVLGQRTVEEVEAAREHLPSSAMTLGFYSFGEISPALTETEMFHNQTMTMTLLSEAVDA